MSAIVDFISGIFWLCFYLALILGGVALWGYNKLRRLVEDVRETESNTAVAIAKKTQLVNDLTALVLRYHQDEQLVMLKVSSDNSVSAMQGSYQSAGQILATINGLAQKYPDLKSNAQFGMLMDQVTSCEKEIQDWRMKFNAAAKGYNVHRASLPHALYAGLLGFQPAQYLNFETMANAAAGAVATAGLADDGERMRELMGLAGTKALGAGKVVAAQGKMLVEKTAARIQQASIPASGTAGAQAFEQFTYLDASNAPQGPVTRTRLDELFAAGQITANTNVLQAGGNAWVRYDALDA